jgi:hypothetical protein
MGCLNYLKCKPHLDALVVGAVGLGLSQERQEPSHGHLMVEDAFAGIETWKEENQKLLNLFNSHLTAMCKKMDTCVLCFCGQFAIM